MDLRGKKLGVLISCLPSEPNFNRGLRLIETALNRGLDVYLYCIDNAVAGVGQPQLQALRQKGLKLYACAYGANRRNIAMSNEAVFAGLTVVNDIMAGTDRFLSFN
jgi:hypothetical protein